MLIDGDNASPSLMGKIIPEAGKYGEVTLRRIYGDWTKPNMKSWHDVLHHHAIQPMQQFRYTTGKNATDCAMIIDAMDILHEGAVDGFCLVSSDSDYTRLATRIREAGVFVMGVGERKTPKALVNACNVFVYTEILAAEETPTGDEPRPRKTSREVKTERKRPSEPEPIPLLKKAFEMVVGDDGWAHLAAVGNELNKLDPGFDPRTYGHKKLLPLIKAHPTLFSVKRQNPKGPSPIYIKMKE